MEMSLSSNIGSRPLGILNKGPKICPRGAPSKSAMERLSESRGKFIRRSNWEELDSTGEENQPHPRNGGQQGNHTVRAVPCNVVESKDEVYQGATTKRTNNRRRPPPVSDKPIVPVTSPWKASRDRTLEIVQASLALNRQQNPVSDEYYRGTSSPHNDGYACSSSSNSPHGSSDENPGSRVRKLREQFLKIGSVEEEEECELSQGGPRVVMMDTQRSVGSSSSSRKSARHDDAADPPRQRDVRQEGRGEVPCLKEYPVSPVEGGVPPAEDGKVDSEVNPTSGADLNIQTRRQMERFKARHATSGASANLKPERKINKIVLNLPKERSRSWNEPSGKISSREIDWGEALQQGSSTKSPSGEVAILPAEDRRGRAQTQGCAEKWIENQRGGSRPTKERKISGARVTVQQAAPRQHLKNSGEEAPPEVTHIRAKSNLAQHTSAMALQRLRHRSQDDQLKVSASTRKVSAPDIGTVTPDKQHKKCWSPVSPNQFRNGGTSLVFSSGNGLSSGAPETVDNIPRKEAMSPTDYLVDTRGGILSPEIAHAHAKSHVQSFLDGKMKKKRQSIGDDVQKDSNGNTVVLTPGMSLETGSAANLNETAHNHDRQAQWQEDINKNVNITSETFLQSKPSKNVILGVPNYMEHADKEIDVRINHEPKPFRGEESDVWQQNPSDDDKTQESEKRRKFSQSFDASDGQGDVFHKNDEQQRRVKKNSLADLLSKEDSSEVPARTAPIHPVVVPLRRRSYEEKRDSNHGDNSETDSDEDLRRSKVLRVRKPRGDNKKDDDRSLEKLLSRIINPADDLNTLKRGMKPSTAMQESETIDTKVSEKTSRFTRGTSPPKVDKSSRNDIARKKTDVKHTHIAPWRDVETTSPPKPLPSPMHGFPRRRSKSDLGLSPGASPSVAHSEVEHFFNQMGMKDSSSQQGQLSPPPLSPPPFSPGYDDVFNEMHEHKHYNNGSSVSSDSDNLSRGSRVSDEGLHRAKDLPDTSKSIITKNARVIKWLVQIRKARASSIS